MWGERVLFKLDSVTLPGSLFFFRSTHKGGQSGKKAAVMLPFLFVLFKYLNTLECSIPIKSWVIPFFCVTHKRDITSNKRSYIHTSYVTIKSLHIHCMLSCLNKSFFLFRKKGLATNCAFIVRCNS